MPYCTENVSLRFSVSSLVLGLYLFHIRRNMFPERTSQLDHSYFTTVVVLTRSFGKHVAPKYSSYIRNQCQRLSTAVTVLEKACAVGATPGSDVSNASNCLYFVTLRLLARRPQCGSPIESAASCPPASDTVTHEPPLW